MRVRDNHASVRLHGVQRVSRHDGMGVSDACGIESVDAVDDEMLIGFKAEISVLCSQSLCERTFAATGKTAQDNAVEGEHGWVEG